MAAAAGAGVLALGGMAGFGGGAASTGVAAHAHHASPAVGVVDPALATYRAGARGGPPARTSSAAAAEFSTLATESFAWQTAAPHPIERFEGNGLAAHGRLWVIGGFGRYTTQASPRSDVYDPATDSWTRIADMPVTVTHSPAVLVGNVIWFLGGFVGNHPGPSTSDVWRYDTSTNSWSPGPSLPAPRGAGGAALLDGKIHYFGGANRRTGSTGYPDEPDHWALDLANEEAGWQPRADVPKARNHLAGAAIGGAIYAVGGQIGGEDTGNQSRVDRYDPATDSWQPAADMPTARGHITASTFVVNGRLIVAGGTNNGNVPSRDMAGYDSATDTWEVLPPLPSGRKTPVMGAINGRLVSSTGYNGTGTNTTWVSTTLPVDEPPAEPGPPLPQPEPEPEPGPKAGSEPEPVPGDRTEAPPPGDSGDPREHRPTAPDAGPAKERGGSRGGSGGAKVSLTLAQLRINQRISQAAVRRVNALEAIVLGRPAPEPPKRPSRETAPLSLTAAQLRINQRISQAALRRVAALERRLDGQPARAEVRSKAGGRITLSARALLINQRISQAAVRRVNALADRVARNDFPATTLARHAPEAGAAAATAPSAAASPPGDLALRGPPTIGARRQ